MKKFLIGGLIFILIQNGQGEWLADKTNQNKVINWNPLSINATNTTGDRHTGRLSFHKDNYILYGFDFPDFTKIQLSFKYRIIYQLYVAYTGRILWDLNDYFGTKSVPFAEMTHNPEVFYEFKFYLDQTKYLDFIRIGYEHKSNGEDNGIIKTDDGDEEKITNLTTVDDKSRSLDSGYLSFNLMFPLIKDKLNLNWRHRYFFIYRSTPKYEELKNIDPKAGLYDIFGWYQYTLTLDWRFDQKGRYTGAFYWMFYNGGDAFFDDKFAFELGLKFKFTIWGTPVGVFLQYFNGYTEGLILDYKNSPIYYIGDNMPRRDSIRLGVVF